MYFAESVAFAVVFAVTADLKSTDVAVPSSPGGPESAYSEPGSFRRR